MNKRTNIARGLENLLCRFKKTERESVVEVPKNILKESRLARIAPLLICSCCGGELNDDKSKCLACGQHYHHASGYFDFLTDEQRRQKKIAPTENVAANEYDDIALRFIDEYQSGLILDCGAGSHIREYANVINYEIVPYSSTDVIGVSEHLPFRDASFDALFALNVLEHVSDPFRAAREISRVLKPKGRLYCVAPFLQPVHGYPNHFYNMSAQGLRQLFEDHMEIDEHSVPPSGLPIWALNWILRSWSDALDKQTRADFLAMRVSDLIADDPPNYLQRDFVTKLPIEKNFELACTTMVLGTKL